MAKSGTARRWITRLAAWLYVGVPLGWDVAQVVIRPASLFRTVLLAVLLPALLTTACSGLDTTAPSSTASVIGNWSLQTVNDAQLPYLMDRSGADKSELTADTFTLIGSGQFTQVSQVRVTSAGQVTTQPVLQAGAFTSNKGAVSVLFAGSTEAIQGSVSATTLALPINGFAFVYKKQ